MPCCPRKAATTRCGCGSDRVWIVDPLDGTNEYGERGRPDWAVHIALWERGVLCAGAVALPAQGIVFASDPPAVVPDSGRPAPRLVTSRFRSPPAAVIVARALEADALRMGSAGAKAMAVVARRTPTSTSTTAGCTSGTRRRPSPSPLRPACT